MTLGTDERRAAAEDEGQASLSDVQADDEQETCTLRERIRAELQPFETLHSLNYSHRHGNTTYFVAVRTCSWDVSSGSSSAAGGMLVRDARTVVYDKETEDVRVTDNGLWVPEDSDAARAEGLLRSFSRTVTDARSDAEGDTLVQDMTGRDADVDAVLSQEVPVPRDDSGDGYTQDVEGMRDHEGIDPSRSWGYYGGAPPEAEHVADRLREAGLQPEQHLIRLQFGYKRPIDTVDSDEDVPTRGYPVDELLGNYGVDCLSQDEGLVCIDVDSPEAFPDVDLPETFEISSPHGGDDRRHMLYYCRDKDELADELGAWSVNDATNAQGDVWGDLWAGANRYVVGAGCQIGAHACNKGDAEVPKSDGCNADGCDSWLGCERCRSGCDVCSDPERGYYRIVQDVPIATLEAATLLQLVPEGEVQDEQRAGNQLSNELPDAEQDGYVRTACCDSVLPEDATFSVGDRHMCADGHGCAGGDGR